MGNLAEMSDSAKVAFLMEALMDASFALLMKKDFESSKRYASYVREMRGESLPNTVAETTSGQAPAGAAITPEQLKELLGTPEKVHLNMLHGHLATITMEQCAHLHGEATQRKWAAALAQKEQSP